MALSARSAARALRAAKPSARRSLASVQACSYSSSSEPTLKETFQKVLPAKRELLKKVKAQADKKLGEVKVENALGGMRYALRVQVYCR